MADKDREVLETTRERKTERESERERKELRDCEKDYYNDKGHEKEGSLDKARKSFCCPTSLDSTPDFLLLRGVF